MKGLPRFPQRMLPQVVFLLVAEMTLGVADEAVIFVWPFVELARTSGQTVSSDPGPYSLGVVPGYLSGP